MDHGYHYLVTHVDEERIEDFRADSDANNRPALPSQGQKIKKTPAVDVMEESRFFVGKCFGVGDKQNSVCLG
jgi:hypothetical protein